MRSAFLSVVLVGCTGPESEDPDSGPKDVEGDADTDTDADSDADSDTDTDVEPSAGIPVLGGGTHDLANVVVTEVLTAADDLDEPSDLEFHPDDPSQLWITNRGSSSMVIVDDAGGPSQTVSLRHESTSAHFMAHPSALAFGAPGWMATIHEEDTRTQGAEGTPPDFMGPTLWTSDPALFDGGDASHADMLHNSPNGTGIAWESAQVYWVFDGYHSSLVRYDFVEPHELGGTFHGDGIIQRWVDGEVGYVEDCVSHLAFDPTSSLLYVADSGNNRIMRLDTTTGVRGEPYGPDYDQTGQYLWNAATFDTLVDGAAAGLELPAGLELVDGLLFLTDAATSTVYAFDLEGEVVDYLTLDRGPGALQGLEVDGDGNLWVTDVVSNSVLKVSAP